MKKLNQSHACSGKYHGWKPLWASSHFQTPTAGFNCLDIEVQILVDSLSRQDT